MDGDDLWYNIPLVFDEEMMKIFFVDIFGQNIADCTDWICLSLLKPERFKTKFDNLFFSRAETKKFDYYLLSMIVKHS